MNEKLNAKEIGEEELEAAAGGTALYPNIVVGNTYTTHVNTGYLALRNYPSYDSNNEIGCLWNGCKVLVTEYSGGQYAVVTVTTWVQGPWGNNVSGRVGYVNAKYLQ